MTTPSASDSPRPLPAGATIAVTGATGFVGRALVASLTRDGARVLRLVRRAPGPGEAWWDPAAGRLDPAALEGVDGVVHLAGESIAAGRWTAERKRRIRDSRVEGTALLARALASLAAPPRVLVSASAVGIYGNRGDEILREDSPPGVGFLAEVGQAWEAAAAPAAAAGIRVVQPRLGIVLSPDGGALARLLLPFRLGVGGPLGSGAQWMSWLSLDDALGILRAALARDELAGPLNAVAPTPVTNEEFTRSLGAVLRRPTLFRVPAAALTLVLGEMAEAALLASQRAVPDALLRAGHRFQDPDLEPALRRLLGRP